MDQEQLIELLEESIETVNSLENKLEAQMLKNETILKTIQAQGQLIKGSSANQLLEAEDKIDSLFEKMEMGFKKLEVIENAYRDLESDAVERMHRIYDIEKDKEEIKNEIITRNLSTLNRDLEGIIQNSIRTVLKKRIDKLDALEADERFEKVLNAEEAFKNQKNNIYKGVATIIAIGVIAVSLL